MGCMNTFPLYTSVIYSNASLYSQSCACVTKGFVDCALFQLIHTPLMDWYDINKFQV